MEVVELISVKDGKLVLYKIVKSSYGRARKRDPDEIYTVEFPVQMEGKPGKARFMWQSGAYRMQFTEPGAKAQFFGAHDKSGTWVSGAFDSDKYTATTVKEQIPLITKGSIRVFDKQDNLIQEIKEKDWY